MWKLGPAFPISCFGNAQKNPLVVDGSTLRIETSFGSRSIFVHQDEDLSLQFIERLQFIETDTFLQNEQQNCCVIPPHHGHKS